MALWRGTECGAVAGGGAVAEGVASNVALLVWLVWLVAAWLGSRDFPIRKSGPLTGLGNVFSFPL